MTTFTKIQDLQDLNRRKVYGLIAIDHHGEWKFSCSLCLGEFPTFDLFNKHFAMHSIKELNDKNAGASNSPEKPIPVNNADGKSRKVVKFNGVADSATGCKRRRKQVNESIKCDICSESFTTKERKKKHSLTVHKQLPHKCRACRKSYLNSKQLIAHMKNHKGSIKCEVKDCGATLLTLYEKSNHLKKVHPTKYLYCSHDGCAFSCNSNEMLLKHKKECI